MRLQNKTAVITGAGKGIGAATAKKFAQEGAAVVLLDVNEADLQKLSSEIESTYGMKAAYFKVDVTDRSAVKELFAKAAEQFGKIDIVVNNAGIVQDAQLLKMTEDQWDSVIDVNLKGVFNVAQAAAEHMKEKGVGVILNASSVVGLYGNFGQTNYAAAKWGVIGMTKTWAKELGKYGIRVNAVAPGFIATEMIEALPDKVKAMMKNQSPLRAIGDPEDVANGYAFLASDEAKYITGTTLSIDGGLVI